MISQETDVINLCEPAMAMHDRRKFVRRYSYASLLYEHIRCGFIHTYRTTEAATSDDALRAVFDSSGAKITYVNSLHAAGMRKIYFPLKWIAGVTVNIAADLDSDSTRHNKNFGENLDLAVPTTWWIDGA
jgi:hypothetical protein